MEREEERGPRRRKVAEAEAPGYEMVDPETLVAMLEQQMREAATALDFEAAARLRDQLFEVKARMAAEHEPAGGRRRRGVPARGGERLRGAGSARRIAPLVPPLAEQGALAMNEAELRDWGRRFGRAAHPPLLVTLSRRARRGQDDARAGDLRGVRRDRRGHQPDVRARAGVRGAAIAGATTSTCTASTRAGRSSTHSRWDEILERARARAGGVAGARGRAAAARARDAVAPAPARRSRRAGCSTRGGTHDHAWSIEASTYAGQRRDRDRRHARARRARRRDARAGARGADAGRRRACSTTRGVAPARSSASSAARVRAASRACASPARSRRGSRSRRCARSCRSPRSRCVVASREPLAPGRYLAAIDAMRGEHYVGAVRGRGGRAASRALGPERRVPSGEVLELRGRARRRGGRARSRRCGARRSARRARPPGSPKLLDATRRCRSGGMGAGVRTARRGAGEVGGGARTVARGRMTALASRPLHDPPGGAGRSRRDAARSSEASFADPWTVDDACDGALAAADAVLVAESVAEGTARGWRDRPAGLCCGARPRSRGGDRRPRRRARGAATGYRACAARARARRAGGGGSAEPSISRSASRTRPPERCTSRTDSRPWAGGGGTIGIRWRTRWCSCAKSVRPEVKCHVKYGGVVRWYGGGLRTCARIWWRHQWT